MKCRQIVRLAGARYFKIRLRLTSIRRAIDTNEILSYECHYTSHRKAAHLIPFKTGQIELH